MDAERQLDASDHVWQECVCAGVSVNSLIHVVVAVSSEVFSVIEVGHDVVGLLLELLLVVLLVSVGLVVLLLLLLLCVVIVLFALLLLLLL